MLTLGFALATVLCASVPSMARITYIFLTAAVISLLALNCGALSHGSSSRIRAAPRETNLLVGIPSLWS